MSTPLYHTKPLLEIQSLRKYFGSGSHPVRAVDDVSFTIHQSETLGLVGESGSGKSTIGRLLTRLLDPTSGHMHYHGSAAAHDTEPSALTPSGTRSL